MIRSLLFAAAVGTSLSFAEFAAAQATVATDPVGFTTLTVNAKPADTRGFTLLSLNMTRPPVFQSIVPNGGAATNGNATTLTFSANSFTAGQFNAAPNGPSHFVEVTNGPSAGLISDITSATTSSVTLADDLSGVIVAGTTTVKIRPMWTFATAFGATNSAGFAGGTSPTGSADIISLINPLTGASANYFYHSTAARWQTGLSDASNHVIPPDMALRIERKAGTALTLPLAGAVKLGTTGVFVQGGSSPKNLNYVPNPYPLASVALKDSNLYTGSAVTGLAGGANPASADNLSLFNTSTGLFTNYFFNTNFSDSNHPNGRWQTGLSDASNVRIPEGTAVLITRKSTSPGERGSFTWYVPQPAMALN